MRFARYQGLRQGDHRKGIAVMIAALVVACLSLGLYTRRVHRPDPFNIRRESPSRGSASGLRTIVINGDKVVLRASAARMRVAAPRLIGPLRFGAADAIEIRDLQIELFENSSTSDGMSSLSRAVAKMASTRSRSRIVSAYIHGLRWIEHEPGGRTTETHAARCQFSARQHSMQCGSGIRIDETGRRRIAQATLGRNGWHVALSSPGSVE